MHALPLTLVPAGEFVAFQSMLKVQLWPQLAQEYVALLSAHMPGTGHAGLLQFNLRVLDALPAPGNQTGSITAAAIATASTNPLVNARLDFVATFPALSLAAFGGSPSGLLSAFQAIVAANARLQGPAWVAAELVSSGTPLAIAATVRTMPASFGPPCPLPCCALLNGV